MSNYNNKNTTVLATSEQAGGNTRMLLFHVCESGRHEYVVGSYFTEAPYARVTFGDTPTTENLIEYSWDWGHYFGSFDKAALYWLVEVKGMSIEKQSEDEDD